MQPTSLFADDDAVSPVIGVILMVAITVILAAVIGAFVLGIGEEPSNAPQIRWDVAENDTANGTDFVNMTHDGGAAVNGERLSVAIAGADADISDDQTLETGAVVYVEFDTTNQIDRGETLQLIWTAEGSSDTTPIREHDLRNATTGENIADAGVA